MLSPDSRTAGYQSWQKLSFLHWRIPAAELQRLVPSELTIEEFDGSAWLGMVPFSMERIRPWWFAAVPGISWFLETNIRTYVVDRRGVRGVWFFSLDANQRLAVWLARIFWHLPYRMASMSLTASQIPSRSMLVEYSGSRSDEPSARYTVSLSVDTQQPAIVSMPGTLSHFLVERYILFARTRGGLLKTGQVHHDPYQLRRVVSCRFSQSLTSAEACPAIAHNPDHVTYCDGVDVRVSPLRLVAEG